MDGHLLGPGYEYMDPEDSIAKQANTWHVRELLAL